MWWFKPVIPYSMADKEDQGFKASLGQNKKKVLEKNTALDPQ